MRPVIRGPRPAAYNPDAVLGKSESGKIFEQLGEEITVATATNAAWQVHLANFGIGDKNSEVYKLYKPITENIYANLSRRYPEASGPLISTLGEFCCYCELATGSIQVDHVVPKKPFIGTIVDWENLLPTCPSCNLLKSNNPSVYEIMGQVADQSDQGLYKTYIRNNYYWPDTYGDTYGVLKPMLCYLDGEQWRPLKNQYAFGKTEVEEILADPVRSVVVCEFTTSTGFAVTYDTRVVIMAGYENDNSLKTISLLNLNRVKDRVADLRVFRRTQTWLSALRRIKDLNSASDSEWERKWRDLKLDARVAGFFSVWVSVLSAYKRGTSNLGRRFINEVMAENLFPGTNPTIFKFVPK